MVSLSAGNRQTNRIRRQYLAALMRQDISYFDVGHTTGTHLMLKQSHSKSALRVALKRRCKYSNGVCSMVQHNVHANCMSCAVMPRRWPERGQHRDMQYGQHNLHNSA